MAEGVLIFHSPAGADKLRNSALLALAISLAGCASSDDVIAIQYKPSSKIGAPQATVVSLVVSDGRAIDRNRISTKIGGYGEKLGAVRSATAVTDTVRAALQVEFEQRGFSIEPGGRVVTAAVDRFYNEYTLGVVGGGELGQVSLTVTVADASGARLYARSYAGSWRDQVLLTNASNAAESVALALRDAVNKMFDDPDFERSLTAQ